MSQPNELPVDHIGRFNLSDLEARAAAVLDPLTFEYVHQGAGDSASANVAAWEHYRLRPRMLRDVSQVSISTVLLDQSEAPPILVAPTAMHRLVCADGELATARAAADAGVVYVVSMSTTTAIEDIVKSAPEGRYWMQAYMRRDWGITRSAIERAAAAGCSTIVLTVDSPVNRFDPRRSGPPLNRDFSLPMLAPGEDSPDVAAVAADYAPDVTFDDLATIRAWTDLPLVVKGIVRGDDAVRCLEAGADGISVSNHGGRQVPGCIPTATALPDVVEAVGGRGPVYVDGGIRSGADVLKALAAGASAVMVGRPVVWGLAIGGAGAASAVLTELLAQLAHIMGLCGVPSFKDIARDLVHHPGVAGFSPVRRS